MRRLIPHSLALGACAGALLLVFPQLAAAESAAVPPQRVASLYDYVLKNVSCGDGACSGVSYADDSEFAEDEEPARDCMPGDNAGAGRWWAGADYLLWWVQGNPLPALVTTGPTGTSVLYGDDRVDAGARSGFRTTLGYWLDDCQTWGVQGYYLYLGDAAGGGFDAQSSGDPILARPFFNMGLNSQDAQLVAFPGIVEGRIAVDSSSEVHSAGVLLRHAWLRGCQGELAVVGGYRYLRFREGLSIRESVTVVDDSGLVEYGTRIDSRNSFTTENDFHGGDIGVAAQLRRARWSLDVLTKLALGNVHQQLAIDGSGSVTVPGDPSVPVSGGLLAQPSNMGHYSQDRFALLPELAVNVRYDLTRSLGLNFGYSMLCLTDVLRTGRQIDTALGSSGAPGAVVHPVALLNDSSMWMQGLNLGVEWRN